MQFQLIVPNISRQTFSVFLISAYLLQLSFIHSFIHSTNSALSSPYTLPSCIVDSSRPPCRIKIFSSLWQRGGIESKSEKRNSITKRIMDSSFRCTCKYEIKLSHENKNFESTTGLRSNFQVSPLFKLRAGSSFVNQSQQNSRSRSGIDPTNSIAIPTQSGMAITNENINKKKKLPFTGTSLYAVLGFTSIVANAMKRLVPIALEPFRGTTGTVSANLPLTPLQSVSYVLMCIMMFYAEGYKGFQKKFSPMFIARAATLQKSSPWYHKILAPFYCMGLFHATKKRKIVSWSLMIGVSVLIGLVKKLSYPYRSIVDGGVIVGLGYGTLSIVAIYFKEIFVGSQQGNETDPELPNQS